MRLLIHHVCVTLGQSEIMSRWHCVRFCGQDDHDDTALVLRPFSSLDAGFQ